MIRTLMTVAACISLTALPLRTRADKPDDKVAPVLEKFSKAWDDSAWEPRGRGKRAGYMRPLDDAGWRARMTAFQELARLGPQASSGLGHALREGQPSERMLAAQVAGYADCKDLQQDLADAAEKDTHPAVRLYAIDSLGMLASLGDADRSERLRAAEKNRDARMHLAYVVERKDAKLDPHVRESLTKWDTALIDSARVGKTAPDFELPVLSGAKVRLSSFRGKKAVVLVFVYGDT